jgi:Cytochrome c554 and c-prime
MQHALQTPGVDPVLEAHPNLSVQIGNYSYAVQTKDGQSTYSVADGTGLLTLPIRWTFGQHSQTWVLEKDGDYYESKVSYFAMEQGLATTPGDGNLAPHNLSEAIGRKVSVWELLQCFNCHATDATAGERLTLDKVRPGVGCERCHEGAEQHLADALHNNFATRPAALRSMSAEDAENFCGQCHRTWQSAVRNHWHGPSDVRFQPYRLANSRCFVGNDQRISCMACHDPHQPVNEDVAFYDAKCLACHAESKKSSHSIPVKTCPVSKVNCVGCHMPKVSLPGGHAVFTDHMIRIVRAGDAYPD